MSLDLEQKRAAWCQPISESSFGGEPSRYEEKYEQLLGEIAKVESLHGGECNWGVVLACADALLCTRTKDMSLLGPLCVALLKEERYAGLAAGLEAYRWLIEQHSAEIFPNAQRVRGRAGAYTWMTERLVKELETATSTVADFEALGHCQVAFNGLDEALRPQLGEQHPRVGLLTRRLGELLEAAKPPPPPPEPPPPPPPPPPRAAAPEPPPAAEPSPAAAAPPVEGTIEDDAQAEAMLEQVRGTLRRLATYHLERDEQRAAGYQLALAASFLGVLPDGDRALYGPSPRQLRELEEANAEGRPEQVPGLLRELLAERDVDLNAAQHVAVALERLGHEAALATVSGWCVGAYLALGELLAVSTETAGWLEGLHASSGGQPARGDDGERAGRSAALEQLIAEADQAARGGLEAGCAVLQQALAATGAKATRFRLQLALASLCLREQAPDLARPILQQLQRELEDPIRAWEPALVVEVVCTLLECNRQLISLHLAPAGVEDELVSLLGLLAQLDPQAALRERAK